MTMFCKIVFTLLIIATAVFCQDCRMYGESCSDDKSCCGGCCESGICIDTYHDCRILDDPCEDFYCPPDMTCEVYHPPDCKGCDIVKECVNDGPPPLERSSPEHMTKNSCKIHAPLIVIYCMTFYLIYLFVV